MSDIDESRIPAPDPTQGPGHFSPDDYDVYKDSRVIPDQPKDERDEGAEALLREEEDG